MNFKSFYFLFFIVSFLSCQNTDNKPKIRHLHKIENKVIIDCNYTFAQSIEGSKAPQSVIDKLELINVSYYSMDGKIHRGQILTNKDIAPDLKLNFHYMLEQEFPVYQVIPIVKYNWDDEVSMLANNSYSFCYRDVTYSKHSIGMAMDINPFQNPLRWNKEYSFRKDKPEGAIYNPKVSGTFYPEHPVVLRFKSLGFRWGRNFTRNNDDHHFEK